MKEILRHSHSGQSMVLVALLGVALVGMLALVLDGGFAYFKQRAAQVAADAGALAGAREYCITGDATLAVNRALEYAVDRNQALEADATVDAGVVTVATRIPFPTFFGGIFGLTSITAGAEAAAGCFTPSAGNGILPVAWNCSPPIEGFDWDSDDCEILFNKLYVIMDSKSSDEDFYCQDPPNSGEPDGALDCDYDDDGVNDLLAAGDRSWLDLDGGGGGSSELVDWINGGFPGEVYIHTWFGGRAWPTTSFRPHTIGPETTCSSRSSISTATSQGCCPRTPAPLFTTGRTTPQFRPAAQRPFTTTLSPSPSSILNAWMRLRMAPARDTRRPDFPTT